MSLLLTLLFGGVVIASVLGVAGAWPWESGEHTLAAPRRARLRTPSRTVELLEAMVKHHVACERAGRQTCGRLVWTGHGEGDLNRWTASWLGVELTPLLSESRSADIVEAGIDQFAGLSGAYVLYRLDEWSISVFALRSDRGQSEEAGLDHANFAHEQMQRRRVLLWHDGATLRGVVADAPARLIKGILNDAVSDD